MAVQVQYFTDPACSRSWGIEPTVRKLMVEFGEGLSWRYVMGGLARDYTAGHEDPDSGIPAGAGVYSGLISDWLDVRPMGRATVRWRA